jgi:lysophospholipase L1-like esterase
MKFAKQNGLWLSVLCASVACAAGAAELPVKTGQKIVFVGDSITLAGQGTNGYASLVAAGFKANGVDVTWNCRAGSGANSSNMVAKSGSFSFALQQKPDWITISCGVNDAKVDGNACPLDQYKANITTMVDKAQAAGIKVMILTTTAWESHGDDAYHRKNADNRNQPLVAYNQFLHVLAKEKGCLLADINTEFQQILKAEFKADGVLTCYDGCHPNDHGHRVMAEVVLKTFGMNEAQIAKAKQSWPEEGAKKPDAKPAATKKP